MKFHLSTIIFTGLTLTGCLGHTPGVCIDACERIYEPSQCGIERPGISAEEAIRRCEEDCSKVLSKPEGKPHGISWAECVLDTACEVLNQNYCGRLW